MPSACAAVCACAVGPRRAVQPNSRFRQAASRMRCLHSAGASCSPESAIEETDAMSQYTNPPQGQNPPSPPNAPSPRQQDPGHSSGQTPPSGQSTPTSAQTPPAAQCPPPNPETPRPSGKCDPLPTGPETPTLPPIDPCDTPCCCPRPPGTPGTCLADLIAKQVKQT